MPLGSNAQKLDLGMPGASLPVSGFAFHGADQPFTSTSATSVPSGRGSDHGQQNPAVSRAVLPSVVFARIAVASARTVGMIWKSNGSLASQSTFAVRRIPRVLSIQLMKA